MKKHSGLYSAVSILLVIVLVAGISLSLLSSGRTRPENPISTQPDRLQAESLPRLRQHRRTKLRQG